MDNEFLTSLSLLAGRVVELSQHDEQLRSQLFSFANALQALVAPKSSEVVAEQLLDSGSDDLGYGDATAAGAHAEADASANSAGVEADAKAAYHSTMAAVEAKEGKPRSEAAAEYARAEYAAREPLPKLTLGQSRNDSFVVSTRITVPNYYRSDEIDFELVEKRCRLKAEAALWALDRKGLIAQGASFSTCIAPKDKELLARTKDLPDCFLWMCHPGTLATCVGNSFDQVAMCFETLADTLASVREFLSEDELTNDQLTKLLELLATAQSALRTAILHLGGPVDTDQKVVYDWLNRTCSERHVFIARHMQLNDPADPSLCNDVRQRAEEFKASLGDYKDRQKKSRKLLGRVRYKANLIARDSVIDVTQWQSLLTDVDELVSIGLPPSNVDLREILLPVIDSIPDDCVLAPNCQLVLREIDRYLARSVTDAMVRPRTLSVDVENVAKLLCGREMVIIGGDKRQANARVLQEAFGLSELKWIETKHHESIETFVPFVSRNEVALVVLAIRWSSHSYGEVRRFCKRFGKPLVRLPAGYNPNQVAAQILSQVSDALQQQSQDYFINWPRTSLRT